MDEHGHGELISDDEATRRRKARFGVLPARILAGDRIETIEVEDRRDLPDPEPWLINRGHAAG